MTLRQEILDSLADDAENIIQIWNHVESFHPDVKFEQVIDLLRKMVQEEKIAVLDHNGIQLSTFPEVSIDEYWFDLTSSGREEHNRIPDCQPQWDDFFVPLDSATFYDVIVDDFGFSIKIKYTEDEIIKKIKIVPVDNCINIYGYRVQATETCGQIDAFSYKTDMTKFDRIVQLGHGNEEKILWER